MKHILLFISFLVAGCAADQSMPPPGEDHPANPAAPTAPIERSPTLATTLPSAASKPATTTTTTAAVYVCPMHPEVTSTDPNVRCRICGMHLVRRKGGVR